MNPELRRRFLIPYAAPLLGLLGFAFVAFMLSRVLLAVTKELASFVALGVAAYVLFLAFLIERRARISTRALAVGVTLGIVAIVGSGFVAIAAGPREFEEVAAEGEEGESDAAGGEEGTTGEEAGQATNEGTADVPADAVMWAASSQLEYTQVPDSVPTGEQTWALELEGLPHNVVLEGVDNEQPIVEGEQAGTFTGTVTLEAGTYTYYCDIAGHREAGMEGEITAG